MTTTTDAPASITLPAHARTVVVGAGFAGMGMAIELQQAGDRDFVVLDRGDEVGGTWRDNTYPGAACDVPSRLYSFSYAQNPGWTRAFSRQGEIQDYLRSVADRYRIADRLITGVELLDAGWDEAAQQWRLHTSAGEITAQVFVLATGALSAPKVPDIPGLAEFPGKVFHTARWDHDYDLAGKRVAVVGTGASAIQVVPAIAPVVERLTLFQRTPPWLLPRPDRPFGERERDLHARVPALTSLVRGAIYYGHELATLGFVREPRLLGLAQKQAEKQLRQQVADPVLRAKVTPTYTMGCKRILLSSNYYPALSRPNVDVFATGLARVEGSTLIGADGSRADVDAVVLATGFEATDLPIAHHIRGAGGSTLAESFEAEGMRALRGTAFPGFPNMFMLVGPNTGVGHTSMVQIIEAQNAYVRDALRVMAAHGIASLSATPRALDAWNADVQRRMAGTVWQRGGCSSWYQDRHGRNTTLWPGNTIRFRRQLRRLDLREYDVTSRAATPSPPGQPGRGDAHTGDAQPGDAQPGDAKPGDAVGVAA